MEGTEPASGREATAHTHASPEHVTDPGAEPTLCLFSFFNQMSSEKPRQRIKGEKDGLRDIWRLCESKPNPNAVLGERSFIYDFFFFLVNAIGCLFPLGFLNFPTKSQENLEERAVNDF